MHPSYSVRIARSLGEVDVESWLHVLDGDRNALGCSPPFLRAIEAATRPGTKYWHLIVENRAGDPVAIATLSTFRADLATLADVRLAALLDSVRQRLPGLLYLGILFCGVPVSAGQRNVVVTPAANAASVFDLIDEVMTSIAETEGIPLLCFKELRDVDVCTADHLRLRGYLRAETPRMNVFPWAPTSFTEYLASLRSHYRYDVRRSFRKAASAGLRFITVTDPDRIASTYDDRLHALYLDVVRRSQYRLETLSREFFVELVRNFPNDVSLMLALDGEKPVGCNWSLRSGTSYTLLFCGIDYAWNNEADVYFNLMYRELGRALELGCSTIEFGQTADSFKARIGCRQERRYLYLRGRHRALNALLRASGPLLFPEPPPPPMFEIFKHSSARRFGGTTSGASARSSRRAPSPSAAG